MRRMVRLAIFGLVVLHAASRAGGEDEATGSEPGDLAPEISATTWLNTEDGESPIEAGDPPRLVLLEFWGTWCGPCVRSMPKVQSLWERYGTRGLFVVAITREAPAEVRPYLEEHAYTMPVACDPSESCISRFRVDGWPTTYLIDRDGRIVWRGAPYGAEAEIEKALGLESSPATLLGRCFDAEGANEDDALLEALDRLAAKAPAAFDLADWARGALGEAPPPAEVPKTFASRAALAHLERIRRSWTDDAKRTRLLDELASAEAEPVDLRAWVGAWYAKAFPLRSAELRELLAARRYDTIIDMFLVRDPSGSLYKLAGRDDGLVDYCRKKQKDAFVFARKGLMGLTYWISDAPPPPGFDWEAFSRDIAVSGMVMDEERKRVIGILIGGERVMKDVMSAYVDRQLGRAFLMDAIASGRAIAAKKLATRIEKERERILKALRRTYG